MALLDLQPAEGEQQKLSESQQQQLEHDLKRLLPGHSSAKATTGQREVRVDSKASLTGPSVKTARSIWRWRQFPMGGWVYHDVPYRWQRVDQGQDFEIPLGRHIIAPGWGHCVSHLSDRPFPYGFGSPYAVVYIGSGRFGGRLWYLGHDNYVQIRAGESFHAGRILARPDHSLNSGWGWSEIGHAANGYPGPMSEGARYKSLFAPVWRWSS
jgi:murein DD-endopeptidase MepM/ murein hydrolase activator NlpD